MDNPGLYEKPVIYFSLTSLLRDINKKIVPADFLISPKSYVIAACGKGGEEVILESWSNRVDVDIVKKSIAVAKKDNNKSRLKYLFGEEECSAFQIAHDWFPEITEQRRDGRPFWGELEMYLSQAGEVRK